MASATSPGWGSTGCPSRGRNTRGCGPGTLTRWMGVPWQTDEASCLSGYEIGSYLLLPSFWAARVPNQVLSAQAYARVLDERLPIEQRLKHLNYRQDWLRYFGPSY